MALKQSGLKNGIPVYDDPTINHIPDSRCLPDQHRFRDTQQTGQIDGRPVMYQECRWCIETTHRFIDGEGGDADGDIVNIRISK